jgi:hypothetical protein
MNKTFEILIFVISLCILFGSRAALAQKYVVEVYNPDKVYPGTTIFGDTTNRKEPMIVEVDMAGKVIWEYDIPMRIVSDGRAPSGMDVEWIPASGNILYTFPFSGVYEVDRNKNIVWSFKGWASHDADRLPNGNTLIVWGWGKDSEVPEVYEVNPKGDVVWKWHAEKHLGDLKQYRTRGGYTHTNSAVRLKNGNTLVSLRNFFALVEIDRSGKIVWKLESLFVNPHDPEELPNGNILVNTRKPQLISEYDRTGKIVWQFKPKDADTIRYNHKLPNGNIIFAERTSIVEISPKGEVVWKLRLKNVTPTKRDKRHWFYKAERIPLNGKTKLP